MERTYEITFHLVGGAKIKTKWFSEDDICVERDMMEIKDMISERGTFVFWNDAGDQLIVIPETSVLYMTINEDQKEER